jgi:cytochrome c553
MTKLLITVVAAMTLASGTAFGGDAAEGQAKSKPCAACHGADGNSVSPAFPRLAGQHYSYLVEALTRYKNGERKNPIMSPQAANLSRRDIEDLAAYFSQQKGLVTKY